MEAIPAIKIESGSVKVMRSYDYCHFEVCLTSTEANTPEKVDELRKTASRLADKAVTQYRIAKSNQSRLEVEASSMRYDAEIAEKTPEDQRTPEQKADIKAYADKIHAARYDYQDYWDDDES